MIHVLIFTGMALINLAVTIEFPDMINSVNLLL